MAKDQLTGLPLYIEPLNPSMYNIDGFCTGYAAKRHNRQGIATAASLDFRTRFFDAVGDLSESSTFTFENPTHGHVVTLLMPHTRPERLALLSALSEYFCLHDDGEDGIGLEVTAERKLARRELLSDLLHQLSRVNVRQAQNILQSLASYAKAAQMQGTLHFKNIEAYINFRFVDFGAEFLLACTMFGLDMNPLSGAERAVVDPFVQVAYRAMALINDYYSFDVENASMKTSAHSANGVGVLMKLNDMSVGSAKEALRLLATRHDRMFLTMKLQLLALGNVPPKVEELLEAVESQIVGKAIWSSTALRYSLSHRRDTCL
ncbi:hypothetical protein B0A48_02925 [Cryoendolithus antarcticus]|uniref:Terpenoid synthase n=1 Tax=Cryoendolithus antarcticus TaxID=1507870 RepID=A0A1V8TLV0_9PEZI|nr:hypothetical protein B0A48_02925 [Cryoendolithus antarcticus]